MIRQTKQRQLIMNAIVNHKVHMSASQVYDQVNQEDNSISLATVYRTLNTLSLEGKIRYVTTLNHEVIYDGSTDPHDHFICKCCGKLFDLESVVNSKQITNLETLNNIQIDTCNTIIEGICESCLKKGN